MADRKKRKPRDVLMAAFAMIAKYQRRLRQKEINLRRQLTQKKKLREIADKMEYHLAIQETNEELRKELAQQIIELRWVQTAATKRDWELLDKRIESALLDLQETVYKYQPRMLQPAGALNMKRGT